VILFAADVESLTFLYAGAGQAPEAPVLSALRVGPALLQEQEERWGQLRL